MQTILLKTLACAGLLLCFAVPASAHDNLVSFDQMMDMFGFDLDTAEVTTQEVTQGLHVLFGVGGNIAVSTGDDGTLIVDDQFPQLMPKIKQAIGKLGSDTVDFVVNTHWHFDHADGNMALGKDGAWIVSQAKSRDMMLNDHLINFGPMAVEQKAYPAHAVSDITFDDSMQFYLNGQRIDLMHVGAAHTNGDAVVIFRGDNAVHMGDVFNNAGYPFIDADNGGDIAGMIQFCQQVHDTIDDDTVVIPGHGQLTDRARLARYIEVLTTIQHRVQTLIDDGSTLESIIEARPTAEFDEEMGVTPDSVPAFLSRVHASLAKP